MWRELEQMAKTPADKGPQVIAHYHAAVRACRPNLSPAPSSELAARPNSCHAADSRAINRRGRSHRSKRNLLS